MSYQAEKISGNQYKISFTIPSGEFDAAMQQSYIKNRGRINVPGFRKGKAPRRLIENMYGEGIFYDDAFDAIFPNLYQQAVDQEDIFPVDQPEVHVDQIGSGKDLLFSATVYVKPDVSLGDYRGLTATRHLHPVSNEEIEHRISHDIRKTTTYEDVSDRALQEGDTANIDYLGSVDGVAFEGGQSDGHELTLGSGAFIPGFEEQLVGMKIGDEKTITVTFPDQYYSQELAGKEARFYVKVNSAKQEVKPEMDDEFARDVSEHQTYEEYHAAIVKELEERRDRNAETAVENELVQKVVDAADCDIPRAMVDRQIDRLLTNMKMRMLYQGIRIEDYLMYTNTTEEDLRGQFEDDARNNIKTELVIEAIAKQESLEADQEDVDAQIARYAADSHQEFETYKAGLNENQLRNFKDLALHQKVVDLIKNSAVIDVHEAEETDEPIDVREVIESVAQALDSEEEAQDRRAKKDGSKAKKEDKDQSEEV